MSMRQYTRELYKRLEDETGLSTGFKPVGFIEAAADEGRLEEYRRVAAFNRHVGLDVQEISPREIADLFPFAETSTCSRASTSPRTAGSTRSTPRCRWPRAPG